MSTNLIQQFYQNAEAHFNINYADKASVSKGNKAVKRLYEIGEKLKDDGDTNQLIKLLEAKENKVDLWAAHILLERFNVEGQVAEKAIKVIQGYANSNDLIAYGEKLWLEQWQKARK